MQQFFLENSQRTQRKQGKNPNIFCNGIRQNNLVELLTIDILAKKLRQFICHSKIHGKFADNKISDI